MHVSDVVAASVHDTTLFKSTTLPTLLHDDCEILADKAYVGLAHVITPVKGKKLKKRDVTYNQIVSRCRALIENLFNRLKEYALMRQLYRGDRNNTQKATHFFHVICALTNLNMQSHPVRA